MIPALRRVLLCCLLILLLAGCAVEPVPAPAPTNSPEPPATATSTATQPPTETLAPTRTATETRTPTSAPTNTPTALPTAAPVTREDGWTVYTVSEDGYSIALPPGWQKLDLDSTTMNSAMEKVQENNPEFSKMLNQQMQSIMATGVKFYGVDLSLDSVKSGFITNVNILAAPVNVNIGLDVIAQLNVNQIETLPGIIKPVNNTAVSLPGGESQRLSYKMNMTMANGKGTTAAFTQFLFLKDQVLYIITFTTRSDLLPGYSPDFEKIAQGFLFSE